MKSYQRLLIFGLVALAFTALLSPWAAAAWEQFISAHAGWEEYRYPFLCIFVRFFIISGIILFCVFLFARLFFSSIHFVQPADDPLLTVIYPWAGVRHVVDSFHPFLDLETLFPGLLGLFLIGAVLCYAFERTGTLYLSIGLHAGWIFSLKTIRIFGDFRRQDLGWLFGSTDPKIVSGVVTWLGLVIVALAVRQFTQKHARLFAVREPS